MPLYSLYCIAAHIPEYQHLRSLVKQAATHVMNNAGVVRDIKSHGTKVLPQRMRRHKHTHNIGDHWQMEFDASPRTMLALRTMFRRDPRVIRWTTLKIAEKVQDLSKPLTKTTTYGQEQSSWAPGLESEAPTAMQTSHKADY